MIRLLTFVSILVTFNFAQAASNNIQLKPVLIDLNNKASLQRGAKIYVNNCLGCHTLKYQRYVKFIDHLSLTKEEIERCSDDSDSDLLSYGWELDGSSQNSLGNQSSPYSEVENDNSLAEGEYVFTLTASDSYGDSDSDSFTVTVLNEPAPIAADNLGVDGANDAFKQVQISWEEGILQSDFDGAYTGDLHNTLYFIVSMNGEERATYQNDAGDGATYTHHERSLDAGSDYEFTVEAFNSDGEGGAISVVSQTTHARPEVTLINPNGGEIYSTGDDYTVEFSTTNDRFISSIDIQFLDSNGQWSTEDENANLFLSVPISTLSFSLYLL